VNEPVCHQSAHDVPKGKYKDPFVMKFKGETHNWTIDELFDPLAQPSCHSARQKKKKNCQFGRKRGDHKRVVLRVCAKNGGKYKVQKSQFYVPKFPIFAPPLPPPPPSSSCLLTVPFGGNKKIQGRFFLIGKSKGGGSTVIMFLAQRGR
jgi:hypothetical protein